MKGKKFYKNQSNGVGAIFGSESNLTNEDPSKAKQPMPEEYSNPQNNNPSTQDDTPPTGKELLMQKYKEDLLMQVKQAEAKKKEEKRSKMEPQTGIMFSGYQDHRAKMDKYSAQKPTPQSYPEAECKQEYQEEPREQIPQNDKNAQAKEAMIASLKENNEKYLIAQESKKLAELQEKEMERQMYGGNEEEAAKYTKGKKQDLVDDYRKALDAQMQLKNVQKKQDKDEGVYEGLNFESYKKVAKH